MIRVVKTRVIRVASAKKKIRDTIFVVVAAAAVVEVQSNNPLVDLKSCITRSDSIRK